MHTTPYIHRLSVLIISPVRKFSCEVVTSLIVPKHIVSLSETILVNSQPRDQDSSNCRSMLSKEVGYQNRTCNGLSQIRTVCMYVLRTEN
jgi:hypothetical protein